MTISVIIPCYNAEKYLAQCLDSVLTQSFHALDVIVVDDGSKDGTQPLAQAYAKRDERVRVLHQENGGVCSARNLGLAHAAGDWIAFVDGDDLLPEHALETLARAAGEGVDMVVGAHETFDEAGNCEVVWPHTRWMDLQGEEKRRAAALRLIEGDSVLNIMCNKLHRREVIERENIRLAAGVKIAEDALFNLEAALCGREIAYVNRVTYRYRLHSQSVTQSRTAGEFAAHEKWLTAMRAMLERRGVMERYYPAYVDSVVLRLYKDGGVAGVVHEFSEKARPLLGCGNMDKKKLTTAGRMLLWLCESGRYAAAYPLIVPFQIVKRKMTEAAFRLRAKKEYPQ